MIGYAFVGTNDLDASLAFYDKLAEPLGAKRLFEVPEGRGWFYRGANGAMLAVATPYDANKASCGNGAMIALVCPDTETVDKAYRTAIEAGASDEGEPGWRLPDVFYGGYFRDPCGNKICVYKMTGG